MKMITPVRAYFEGHPRRRGLFPCVLSSLLVYLCVIDPIRAAQPGEPIVIVAEPAALGIILGLMGILYVTLGSAFHEWMFKDGTLTLKGYLAMGILGGSVYLGLESLGYTLQWVLS